MRTATIMSKVFLHHLGPLIALQSFSELWLDVLDYIEKFMHIGSDLLHEAMRESLKNMLLVMHSVSVPLNSFHEKVAIFNLYAHFTFNFCLISKTDGSFS